MVQGRFSLIEKRENGIGGCSSSVEGRMQLWISCFEFVGGLRMRCVIEWFGII